MSTLRFSRLRVSSPVPLQAVTREGLAKRATEIKSEVAALVGEEALKWGPSSHKTVHMDPRAASHTRHDLSSSGCQRPSPTPLLGVHSQFQLFLEKFPGRNNPEQTI